MTPAQILPPATSSRWTVILVIGLATFALDLALPLGVAAGVPYVLAILLTMDRGSAEMTRSVALSCGVLVVVGWVLSEPIGASWIGTTNRFLSLVAIGATALAVLRSKRLRLALADESAAHHRVQAELLERNAMARLGEMASVVAHEVKNPLTGISNSLEVLSARLPLSESEQRLFRTMRERLLSLDATIEDLLVYARPRAVNMEPTDLVPLLAELAADLAERPSFAGISVRLEAARGPVSIRSDPSLVTDAVRHLALNAAQALGGKGEITLGICSQGARASLTVRDNGPGIPDDLKDKVLEPFFTTRSRGTGLGLAIARRCAEVHEGQLSLRTPTDGVGTLAELVLGDGSPV